MAIVISFCSLCGGSGKTSSVAAIGEAYCKGGYRVLMVDLDSKASLTHQFLGVERANLPQRLLQNALLERKNLPQLCLKENLYLCPNWLEMGLFEPYLYSEKKSEFILRELLSSIDDRYDFILLDCPSAYGIMTINAIYASDRIVAPVNATPVSYYNLKTLVAYLDSLNTGISSSGITDIFFNFYDPQLRLTKLSERFISEEFGPALMCSVVRRNVKISEAAIFSNSVIDSFPDSTGAKDFISVSVELLERICKKSN